jgi:hypothetical protein
VMAIISADRRALQVQVALFMDGMLYATFEHMSNARRWRAYKQEED